MEPAPANEKSVLDLRGRFLHDGTEPQCSTAILDEAGQVTRDERPRSDPRLLIATTSHMIDDKLAYAFFPACAGPPERERTSTLTHHTTGLGFRRDRLRHSGSASGHTDTYGHDKVDHVAHQFAVVHPSLISPGVSQLWRTGRDLAGMPPPLNVTQISGCAHTVITEGVPSDDQPRP